MKEPREIVLNDPNSVYPYIRELENNIADIKANCDLAIEGRDVKIKELEQRLEQTEKDLADYQFNFPTIKELEKENEELKAQIEKMKCCSNCKHRKNEVDRCELLKYSLNAYLCKNKDKWELKE